MSFGFGFSLPAYEGYAAGFGPSSFGSGASLALDFLNGNNTLDPRITFSRTTNATLTNSAGLVANAPMNLLTFSEQFDNAAWTKRGTFTVAANQTVAPNGTTTADLITGCGVKGANDCFFTSFSNTNLAPAGARTPVSVSIKRVSTSGSLSIQHPTSESLGLFIVNLALLSDNWERITETHPAVTVTNPFIASPLGQIGVQFFSTTGTISFAIWGAQLELGSTATTYNPTTVKNLLGFTEHFDNAAWTKSNASISATKVDDIYGQPFAQKLVEDTTNGVHRTFQAVATTTGTTYTNVIYAKAGERSWLYLAETNLVTASAYFNLATGVVGTVAGSGSPVASITSIGNGWYRCALSYAAGGTSSRLAALIATADGVNSYTGDGTSGIYIFGAQLADSASVDPYVYQPVAAPSSVAYYGPRFDYDPVTLAPKGLLIEEQRTNLLLQSENFTTTWLATQLTSAANTSTAPDGTVTADTLTASAGTGFIPRTGQNASLTSGTAYTFSAFCKAGTYSNVQLYTGTFPFFATFNLATGTVGASNGSATITPVGNGWYRCSLTYTASSTASSGQTVFIPGSSTATQAQSWNPTGTESVLIWGAQLEAGAFATSYIPTVASQVTRAADSASMIGNNFARWYTQGPGTLYADSTQALTTANTFALFSAGVNIIRLGSGKMDVFVAGTPSAQIAGTVTGGSIKQAGAYQVNDFAISTNGGAVSTDTSGAVPFVDSATFSSAVGNSVNGTVKRIAYYNRRLSNTELQSITA